MPRLLYAAYHAASLLLNAAVIRHARCFRAVCATPHHTPAAPSFVTETQRKECTRRERCAAGNPRHVSAPDAQPFRVSTPFLFILRRTAEKVHYFIAEGSLLIFRYAIFVTIISPLSYLMPLPYFIDAISAITCHARHYTFMLMRRMPQRVRPPRHARHHGSP
jgi:hypothetical protein